MSKFATVGVVAGALIFGTMAPAEACHRHCCRHAHYCGGGCGYAGSGCGGYASAAPMSYGGYAATSVPIAPVASNPVPPAPQTAGTENQTYRSFSAEPAPAPAAAAPVYAAPAQNLDTANNHNYPSGTYYGGFGGGYSGSSTSRGGTANAPAGLSQ